MSFQSLKMANWLNYKRLSVLSLLILLSFSYPVEHSSIVTWGFYGHKRINRIAVFTLPPALFGFYKEHIEFLTEHAVDPDKRRYAMDGEAQCHYIDLDRYYSSGEDPFAIIPRKWTDAVAKYSEDTLQKHGIVPWHINVMKMRLQKAFESQNIDLILKYSADIGHYIGDAHVPLHTTENYNGQLTGQKGIHGLWESRLVEINADEYNYFVGKAIYIERVLDCAWDAVKASHMALDSVLRIEKELTEAFTPNKKYSYEQRGNAVVSTYSYEFSKAYHHRLNGMVERRMRAAIITVGSIWYTAWVDAGQPDLSRLQNTPPSQALLEEMKALDAQFRAGCHTGRTCD
jgi:hypothetical protein